MIISLKLPLKEYEFSREVTELASAFFDDFQVVINSNQQEELLVFENDNCQIGECLRITSKKEIYETFLSLTKKNLEWGTLTGVRPVKLFHKLAEGLHNVMESEMQNGLNAEGQNDIYSKAEIMAGNVIDLVKEKLEKDYYVSSEKIELLRMLYETEKKCITEKSANMISVYVSIPFCPSRCSYCSFTSNVPKKDRSDIKTYLSFLFKEISRVGEITKILKIQTESIYIGGGTPGILDENETGELIRNLTEAFEGAKEITFEAGRPDEVTYKKLKAASDAGANRICINPQTMNKNVLKACGRKHSPEDVIEAFKIARNTGFKNINMDLIIGLPEDNSESILDSIDQIMNLNPENITVHSLSLKKGSDFMETSLSRISQECPDIFRIVKNKLSEKGYNPYYLYRQKHMWMNAENIGYTKEGFESIFNLQSMADRQTIIALGADGISKFVTDQGTERFHNPKGLKEYEEHIDDVVKKKTEMIKDSFQFR